MHHFITGIESFVMSQFGLVTIAIGAPVLWLAYRAIAFLASPYLSPLKVIDGPPNKSYLFGHFLDLVNGNGYKSLREYYEQYGHVYLIQALLGVRNFISVPNKS